MSKGHGHAGNKKSSNSGFKKRCSSMGCKKKAKYELDGKYYCKRCVD